MSLHSHKSIDSKLYGYVAALPRSVMKPLCRKEVLGTYRFYGMSEVDMLNDLGNHEMYDPNLVMFALYGRLQCIDNMHANILCSPTVH